MEDRDVDLLAERLQLGHGRGSVGVGRDQQGFVALLADVQREFAGQCRFASTLQAHQQDNRRRLRGNREPWWRGAQQLDQLVVHDLDDGLVGRQAMNDILPDRLLLDAVDELPDDLQ